MGLTTYDLSYVNQNIPMNPFQFPYTAHNQFKTVKNGDGKTCATAWPVIQIDEEYFILQMLGAALQKQSIDNTGGLCDKMEVKTEEGDKKTYYFETSKVFEGYKKLGLK